MHLFRSICPTSFLLPLYPCHPVPVSFPCSLHIQISAYPQWVPRFPLWLPVPLFSQSVPVSSHPSLSLLAQPLSLLWLPITVSPTPIQSPSFPLPLPPVPVSSTLKAFIPRSTSPSHPVGLALSLSAFNSGTFFLHVSRAQQGDREHRRHKLTAVSTSA